MKNQAFKMKRVLRPWIRSVSQSRRGYVICQFVMIMALLAVVRRASAQAGSVDPGFTPPTNQFITVTSLVLEPTGSLLASGFFDALTAGTSRSLVRVTLDGSIDPSFNPGTAWGEVLAVARQPDGKILIGGFNNSQLMQHRIARLNPDGSQDSGFDPGTGVGDNFVDCIAVQTNGQIIIGGAFSSVAGVARNNLARLNANGSLDMGFHPVLDQVSTVAIQPDGKLLVANGFSGRGVTRLAPEGSVDSSFNSALDIGAYVRALALQADGKLVVCGRVPVAGMDRGLARLNDHGSIDTGFGPGPALLGQTNNAGVYTLALQSDGKILVGGQFARFGDLSADAVVRLNSDGTSDAAYDPGTINGSVQALLAQADGTVVMGGSFARVGELNRNGLARLLGGDTSSYVGRFQFSTNQYYVGEGAGQGSLTLLRTRSSNGVASVSFATSDGTGTGFNDSGATAGQDYQAVNVTLNFTNGQGSARVAVPIIDDPWGEPSENVAVALSHAGPGGVLGQPNTGLLTILDNDSAFEFSAGAYTVLENAGTLDLYVWREGLTTLPASVQYAAQGGTAVPGSNYQPISGTLNFASGQNFAPLSVPILHNAVTEGNKFFNLILTNPSKGTTLNMRSNAVATIVDVDDDGLGSVVPGFNPTLLSGFSSGGAWAAASQPDGHVFIAGNFTLVDGVARPGVARLNADGSLDAVFNPEPTLSGNPGLLFADTNGGLIIDGGFFSATNGYARNNLARLNPDGSLDTNFDAHIGGGASVNVVGSYGSSQLLVGGTFQQVGDSNRTGIARLNADGSLDNTFNPVLNANGAGSVSQLAIQTDGKILVAGGFSVVNGITRRELARLNADGSLDQSFDPGNRFQSGITALALQRDGKILVGTPVSFSVVLPNAGLFRLNADGSLDATFPPVSVDGDISRLIVLADGKIVIGGSFSSVNGLRRVVLARLQPDGSVDAEFDTGNSLRWGGINGFNGMALEADGDLLMWGGDLYASDGTYRTLVRLRGTDPTFIGRFEFTTAAADAWETNGTVSVTVRRSGNPAGPASVQFTYQDVTATNGLDYLLTPGTLDFAPGETNKSITVSIVKDNLIEPQKTLQLWLTNSTGAILGSQASTTIRILDHPGGLPDPTFTIGGSPDNLYLLAGGKVLGYSQLGGLVRFNQDGTIDTSFDGSSYSMVRSVTPSADGKVYVCDGDGLAITVKRLLADGSVDPAFATIYTEWLAGYPYASAMAVQADGKLLVGWTTESGFVSGLDQTNTIARFDADGSPDTNFNPSLTIETTNGITPQVTQLLCLPDGTFLALGNFTSISGNPCLGLARLHADGSVDTGFHPDVPGCVAMDLQADGHIIIGGSFTHVNSVGRNAIARLNPDGTLDMAFASPFESDSSVFAVRVQPDNKVLVGGVLYSLDRRSLQGLLRLDTAGNVDGSFDPTVGIARSILLQGDGRVVAGAGLLMRFENDPSIGGGGVEFGSPTYTVSETNSTLTVSVRRVSGSKGIELVPYSTRDGNAIAGTNYEARSGIITFNDGDANTQAINIPMKYDPAANGDQQFIIGLGAPIGGAAWGTNATASVTVLEIDIALAFATNAYWIRENGGSQVIEVRRIGNLDGTVTVGFATADGTAQAGWDYSPTSGTLTFAPGQTNQTFTIPILNDSLAEADETVSLALSQPTGGARFDPPATAVLTILDDDHAGTLDPTFDPGAGVFSSTVFGQGQVQALAIQSDGRILVGGVFDSFNGVQRYGMARLLASGSLDLSYSATLPGSLVGSAASCIRLQTNDMAVVLAGSPFGASYVLRLQTNGIADPLFRMISLDGPSYALEVRPDGKILIGGRFQTVNGAARPLLALVNADGSLDNSFAPVTVASTGAFPTVTCLAHDSDGKTTIGGTFETVGALSRHGLARLLSTGALDTSFDPGSGLADQNGLMGFSVPNAIMVEEDGKLIVGGTFAQFDGVWRTNLVRLQTNGALDSNFNASATLDFGTAAVRAMALQPDGKIIVGGSFRGVNGALRNGLARLNLDGSIDPQFHFSEAILDFTSAYPSIQVEALALQPDGQILIGGSFALVDGEPQAGIARVKGTDVIPTEPLLHLGRLNGKYEVQFTGVPGRAYLLQTSTNLTDWQVLGQIPDGGGGLFQLGDADSDKIPLRYYRVVSR